MNKNFYTGVIYIDAETGEDLEPAVIRNGSYTIIKSEKRYMIHKTYIEKIITRICKPSKQLKLEL
jgi:hypothetical protein